MSEHLELFATPPPLNRLPFGDESFLLASIDLFNWGPFHGRHRCAIDAHGTAIIGPTGSGKTTLIDALMTLLAPFPKYNLASTGGHESDRDLISYIRGVSGVENAQEENGHVARPGKTLTGLAATYSHNRQAITLGCLLWVDGSSNAADDLKRLWFIARDLLDPLDALLLLHNEGGKAALTRHARETTGLRLSSSKKDYLAHVRSFFEVGENAFSLLNRAAGLKQINSIDQIFRELVLDDRSAFDRAAEVAREFDTLHGIYEELQTARRQREVLLPVRQSQTDLAKTITKLAARRRLKDLLPNWFAHTAVRLWQTKVESLDQAKNEIATRLHAAEHLAARHEQRVQSLNKEYLRHGGAAIQDIEELIRAKEQHAAQVRSEAQQYLTATAKLGLLSATDKDSYVQNSQRLPEIKTAATAAHEEARQQAVNLAAKRNQQRDAEHTLSAEIQQVEARPNSNIPAPYQAFRELLASELGMTCDDLPYLAEMIEVKVSERHWQGAIERAIGSERLRILVPAHRMEDALAWINRRDNRLHIRLQSADSFPAEARFFDDGFTRKLDYRSHPLREHVKLLLSRRDRHCVDSIEKLRHADHAMTLEGTMSDREGRFEKQDQKPLTSGWMTGFDNRHLLATLLADRKQTRETLARLDTENSLLARAEREGTQKISLIEQLETLAFEKIDLAGVEREIALHRQRLADLTAPESDASATKIRFEQARLDLQATRKEITNLTEHHGAYKNQLKTATDTLTRARNRCGDPLSPEDSALVQKKFALANLDQTHQLEDAERTATQAIHADIQRTELEKSDIEKRLIRLMEKAKQEDTGALTDIGTELRDLDAYLLRLKTLEEESLPEKLHRFLDYLNQSSGQGVTQLLTHITNEVTLIQERVSDLNATLSRVDFREGQFLQLHAQAISHSLLQQMETAQRKLRHIVLSQREDDGEAHYRALGEVVRLLREAAEKRHTQGSQALLDPRHRLQFSVVEVDRATGRSSGARKGSQTGSGGEKEMMASYILTASLSYALCPAGATTPRYATIVLDEAFSKSSPAAAARIIEALRAFGLHPLFVTPNKEISLLKSHTRSAVLVHNKNQRATLTSLTWEEIDAHARTRKAADPAAPATP